MTSTFDSELSMIKQETTHRCLAFLTVTETTLSEMSEDLLQLLTLMTTDSPNLLEIRLLIEQLQMEWNLILTKTYESMNLFSSIDSSPIVWQSYRNIRWKRPILHISFIDNIQQLVIRQYSIDKEIYHHSILKIIAFRESILREQKRTQQTIQVAQRYLTHLDK